MNTKATAISLQYTETGQAQIVSTVPNTHQLKKDVAELKEVLANGKELSLEIKQYRKARSLNANSYCWLLCDKIAEAWSPPSIKDDIYIEMLKRYGQYEKHMISVIAEAADMIYRATNKHCKEVDESELNGKVFKHFRIIKGSSGYDTKEMSVLIDGIVQEAKDLGIETMTPQELEILKSKWGKKNENI